MQKKLLIFGNSGSGKSSLAKHISKSEGIALLDLDTIAWLDTNPPQRAPLDSCLETIQTFMMENESWIAEGCYTDLLELLSPNANEIIFLNLPIKLCIENAKKRPWEPHKYASKQAQDKNLPMLLEWIKQYNHRSDDFSRSAHLNFYNSFSDNKQMHTTNTKLTI